MRHLLGVLGVLAASVLLAVSAAMNWQFGFGLGRTEFDGQLLGAASAAADCLKALIPFFFFAAIRNRMWSQALAAAVVGLVVVCYSMTSALGFAAKQRNEAAAERMQITQSYEGQKSELKRAEEAASWIPQHRPVAAVQAAIESFKAQPGWKWSNGCKDVSSKSEQKYCQGLHTLEAELASAKAATEADARIADIKAKLASFEGSSALADADPQAKVLADLATLALPNVKIDHVQTAMAIFVALLLEIGSSFGMYVAFSQWRLYDRKAPEAPAMATLVTVPEPVMVAQPAAAPMIAATPKPRVSSANDNSNAGSTVAAAKPAPKLVAPETDVERFYKERIDAQDGSSLTATGLYEDYCAWCEEQEKEPLALPTFGREFGELGVQKAKIAGRVRYIGIALRSGAEHEEDKKTPQGIVQAA